jgi:uncharacterized protein YggU (UPF0235/DUF167 family)
MSTGRKFEFTDAKGGAAVGVRVITRATNTEVAGLQDDGVLKVRLKASTAGDPAANQELVAFLSEQLGVPVEKIEIVAGSDKSEKIVTIEGITTADVEAKFGSVEG